ncbi:hypothetical protein C8J55DRAFT_524636 [Lentinula edodes]|uniref:C2H2-type domain-containing protein n=1 Tax=Lentinula lateritia TaxID=40482 RepID=A0A9W8ZWB2_9AGAR|nr:hypothetical protein C8J55DRAFT_524636 [Lentinula edodes]
MVCFNDTPVGLSQSTSAFTCSKNGSDKAYSSGNCDLVSNFQRNFCSNFVCICCYVRLPSLHDLYDHVEEAHIGPSGTRAWPPKVFSELSEISGPPRATSPFKDQDLDCTPDESILAIAYSTQDFNNDSAVYKDTLHLDYCMTCDPESFPQCPPLRHPFPRYEQSCHTPPPPNVASGLAAADHRSTAVQDSESEPESPKHGRESSAGPIRSRLRNRERRADVPSDSPLRVLSSKSSLIEPRTNVVSREPVAKASHKKKVSKVSKKDLIYNCPTPGCIKTYRNANGLKYHKDKGTCLISKEPLANNHSCLPAPTPYSPRPSTPPMDYLAPPTFSSSSPIAPQGTNTISCPSPSLSAELIHTSPGSSSLRSHESPFSSCSRSLSPLSILASSESPPTSPIELPVSTATMILSSPPSDTDLPVTVFAPAVALTLNRPSSCRSTVQAVPGVSERHRNTVKTEPQLTEGLTLDDDDFERSESVNDLN